MFFGTFRGRGFPITSGPRPSSAGDALQALPEPAQLPCELARLVAESIAEKQWKERGIAPAVHARQVPGRSLEGDDHQARRLGSPRAEGSAGNGRHAAASDSPLASSVHE